MKIFEKNSKTNFVDDNNVLVGFDSSPFCCENFGWFINTSKSEIILEVKEIEIKGFQFDTTFFEKILSFENGNIAIFRLVKKDKELFLHLYNMHNGYYSHGFKMFIEDKVIQQGKL